MRVVQINAYYPTGSTGKLVAGIDEYLQQNGIESYVIYGRGPFCEDSHKIRIAPISVLNLQSLRAKVTGFPYAGCHLSTQRMIKLIKEIGPDIVHLHCINGFMVNIYRLLQFLKENRIRTVLTLHACFMFTGGCSHTLGCEKWRLGCGECPQIPSGTHPKTWLFDRTRREWELMRESFEGFDNLIVCPVSDWVHEQAALSPFFSNVLSICTVKNGVDVSVYRPRDTAAIRKRLELTDKRIVLHVTPDFSSPIKGGRYVMDVARKLRDRSDIKLIVVGKYNQNDACLDNVMFLGEIEDESELALLYSVADVSLLTSKRETYSMVTAESLCCGTPVAGFKAGGPESIALPAYSCWAEQGDSSSLIRAVLKLLDTPFDRCEVSRFASLEYSMQTMAEQYAELYKL